MKKYLVIAIFVLGLLVLPQVSKASTLDGLTSIINRLSVIVEQLKGKTLGAIVVVSNPVYHPADTDKNYKIELAELNAYKTNFYDTKKISLTQLSRVVTFYNAGGYKVDPSTSDGFAPILCGGGVCVRKNTLIFVDSALYNSIKNSIGTFINDLKKDTGGNVTLLSGEWGSPSVIKNKISEYKDGLYGIFLIGDLPYVEFARAGDPGLKFISDYFYADIDNNCLYNNQYGFYDFETCAFGPSWYEKTWVARIKPNNKTDQITALIKYFDKNHRYRTGQLTYDKKFLYYNTVAKGSELDDSQIDNYINDEMNKGVFPGTLYSLSNSSLLIAKSDTNPLEIDSRYLTELSKKYEWVRLNNHGSSNLHEYNITSNSIFDMKPKALFYQLESCLLGQFDQADYMAASYVFSDGDGLLALADTAVVANFNYNEEDSKYMFLLSRGVNFAEAMRNKISLYNTWIGDPTLKLRYLVTPSSSNIQVSKTNFDLGKINSGYQSSINFKIKNIGTAPLVVNAIPRSYAFHPEDFIWLHSSLYEYMTILPGAEQEFSFNIAIRTTPGKYKMSGISILSNSDNNPLINTNLTFEVL